MPRLVMVRHGRAAARWTEDRDPGLDEQGHEQARQAVRTIESLIAPRFRETGVNIPILTSPLRRCRETATPLAQHWERAAEICHGVSEIPSPDMSSLDGRGAWLARVMAGRWDTIGAAPEYRELALSQWRSRVVESLTACATDTVIFSHFVAINVAVGAATGVDDVICFRPGNASCTVFETDGQNLQLVNLGHEAETFVN